MVKCRSAADDEFPRLHPRIGHFVALVPKWEIASLIQLDRFVVAVLEIESLHTAHLALVISPDVLSHDHREAWVGREIDRTAQRAVHLLSEQVFLGQGPFR